MIHTPRLLLAATAVLLAAAGFGCSKAPEVSAARTEATAPASNVSDADVTEHVKTVISQEATLKGTDISVATLKGDVRLTGVLATQTQIDTAMRIARAAEGTHTIHDELTLKK